MSISGEQLANTTADAFDVEYRYFGGPRIQDITLSDYPDFNTLIIDDVLEDETGDWLLQEYTTPIGWTISGDTITPGGGSEAQWYEITNDIYYEGTFTQTWDHGKITWQVNLKGQEYKPWVYGLGQAVLCFVKYTRYHSDDDEDLWSTGWVIDWLGICTSGRYGGDYKVGDEWERTVVSVDLRLSKQDGPRLTTELLNGVTGATVTAKSTLSDAERALESANQEFVGTTADVSAGNTVDGELRTLWISQGVPTSTATSMKVYNDTNEGVRGPLLTIDEVFFKPVAGYSNIYLWWFEIVANGLDAGADLQVMDCWIAVKNRDGSTAIMSFKVGAGDEKPGGMVIERGKRLIVCGHKGIFEAYTGGVWDSDTIVVSPFEFPGLEITTDSDSPIIYWDDGVITSARDFNLHPTEGWIIVGFGGRARGGGTSLKFNPQDVVSWSISNTGMTFPTIIRDQNWHRQVLGGEAWRGDPVDVSSLTAGHSIRRATSGQDYDIENEVTDSADSWETASVPTPGTWIEPDVSEWLKIGLPSIEDSYSTTLSQDEAADVTTLHLDDTTGWPTPGLDGYPTSGSGNVEGHAEIFEYTGKTATTLTGVTDFSVARTDGEVVFPNWKGTNMTGRYLSSIQIERPAGRCKLYGYSVYLSTTTVASDYDPDNDAWKTEYDGRHYENKTNGDGSDADTASSVITISLANLSGMKPEDRWVRTALLVIHDMYPESDDTAARAKVNEIRAFMSEASINDSGLGDLASPRVYELIEYILINYSDDWITTDDVIDELYDNLPPAGYGTLGPVQTAVTRVSEQIEDVARIHGCVVNYGRTGGIRIMRNPWWPDGLTDMTADHVFSADDYRGRWSVVEEEPTITGVAVSGKQSNGSTIERIVYAPGVSVTDTGIREYTDLIMPNPWYAKYLARSLYYRDTEARTMTIDVKGIGEWCEPLQRYHITALRGGQYLEDADGLPIDDSDGSEHLLWGDPDVNEGYWICEQVTRTWNREASGKKAWQTTLGLRHFTGTA